MPEHKRFFAADYACGFQFAGDAMRSVSGVEQDKGLSGGFNWR
jgi:hypothetical protein